MSVLFTSDDSRIYSPSPTLCAGSEDAIKETYNAITTALPWRHSIGRGTSVVKVGIYSLGFCLQSVKIIAKAVVSPFASLAVCLGGGKQHECSWTMKGVAKDAIMAAWLIDRGVGSTIGFACAPHKKSNSIFDAMSHVASTLNGSYHLRTLTLKKATDTIGANAQYVHVKEPGKESTKYVQKKASDVTDTETKYVYGKQPYLKASEALDFWKKHRADWSELVLETKSPISWKKQNVFDAHEFAVELWIKREMATHKSDQTQSSFTEAHELEYELNRTRWEHNQIKGG